MRSAWLGLSFALLSFALLSCTRPPLTPPLDGGPSWSELDSEHFVVLTDASAGRARDLVQELEQSFQMLQGVFDYQPPLLLKVRVVSLDSANGLQALGHANFAGFVRSGLDGFESRDVVVLTDSQRRLDPELLLHELTHRFIAFYMPSAPLWLNEGLAEYYSTMRFDDGKAIIGEYLSARTFTPNSWGFVGVDGAPYLGIPMTEVPRASALRGMSSSEFYTDVDSSDARLGMTARYSGAWALVHTLTLETNGHRRLKAYLDDLYRASLTEREAWQKHFGDLPEAQLQRDFERFMSAHATDVLSLPVNLHPPAQPTERALSASEVHTLWAELRGPGDPLADRDLQRAIEADPKNPEAYLQRAFRSRAKHEDLSVIERDVDKAYQLAPDEPRYLLGKAKLEYEKASALASPATGAAYDSWTKRLISKGHGAPELSFLASVALARQRLPLALHFARKALAADPSAYFCYVVWARVAAARKDYGAAASALRTALNLLAHGLSSPKLQAELESYEALARTSTHPKAEPEPEPER